MSKGPALAARTELTRVERQCGGVAKVQGRRMAGQGRERGKQKGKEKLIGFRARGRPVYRRARHALSKGSDVGGVSRLTRPVISYKIPESGLVAYTA